MAPRSHGPTGHARGAQTKYASGRKAGASSSVDWQVSTFRNPGAIQTGIAVQRLRADLALERTVLDTGARAERARRAGVHGRACYHPVVSLEAYRPPTFGERLTNPFVIAGILGLLLVGGVWGYARYERFEHEQREREIEPLQAEWDRIRQEAIPRLQAVAAKLDAEAPGAEACEGLEGRALVVFHRPLLEALAAGEQFPRPDAPAWSSSEPVLYLSHWTTPATPDGYRARNDAVRALLTAPAIAILDTAIAERPEIDGPHTFEGGLVAGRLSIVDADGEPLCSAPVASAPLAAVSVEQSDPRIQAAADADALRSSAANAYWKAVDEALAEVAPGTSAVR